MKFVTLFQDTCSQLGGMVEKAQSANSALDAELSAVGYSKRPTVAEWLHAKEEARRRSLQTQLLSWDR